jgi:ribonuclease VapC
MFIDASAIVSILTREPDAAEFAQAVGNARSPITSPIAIFEATLGIRRKYQLTVERAERNVLGFLTEAGIEVVPISAKDAETALDAYRRYGKGQGHPAQLNLGDCFAYAVAKNHRTPLLYKGNDFTKTDLASP